MLLRVLSTPFSKKTQKNPKIPTLLEQSPFWVWVFLRLNPPTRGSFSKRNYPNRTFPSDLGFHAQPQNGLKNQNGMMAMFFSSLISSLISSATPNWLIFLLFLNMHRFHAKCLQNGRWHLVLLVKSGLDSLDKL